MALISSMNPVRAGSTSSMIPSAVLGALVLSAMAACAPDTVNVQRSQQFSPDSVKRIALLPFSALPGSRGVYRSMGDGPVPNLGNSEIRQSFETTSGPVPLRSHATTIAVPESAPALITHMVFTNLLGRPGLDTTSPDIAAGSLPKGRPIPELIKSRSENQRISQSLGVDALLYGVVRVYREREGAKLAAIPAAVGFEMYLVDGKTGLMVWKGDFFEEQKPLTEDVKGFFARGGTFITAEELARSGVHRVMSRFPVGQS